MSHWGILLDLSKNPGPKYELLLALSRPWAIKTEPKGCWTYPIPPKPNVLWGKCAHQKESLQKNLFNLAYTIIIHLFLLIKINISFTYYFADTTLN